MTEISGENVFTSAQHEAREFPVTFGEEYFPCYLGIFGSRKLVYPLGPGLPIEAVSSTHYVLQFGGDRGDV